MTIPPSAVGKSSTLLRTLNRYLNSQAVIGEDDGGLSVYRQVAAVLEKGSPSVDTDAVGGGDVGDNEVSGGGKQKVISVVKTEVVTDSSQMSSKGEGLLKSAPVSVKPERASRNTNVMWSLLLFLVMVVG